MSVVLAAVDAQAGTDAIVDAAVALAARLDARVDLIHVVETPEAERIVAARFGDRPLRSLRGVPADVIVDAARDEDVVALVVGARRAGGAARPAGHVTSAVMERADKPVAVVPPTAPPGPIDRALVPLEGSAASSVCVADVVTTLAGPG